MQRSKLFFTGLYRTLCLKLSWESIMKWNLCFSLLSQGQPSTLCDLLTLKSSFYSSKYVLFFNYIFWGLSLLLLLYHLQWGLHSRIILYHPIGSTEISAIPAKSGWNRWMLALSNLPIKQPRSCPNLLYALPLANKSLVQQKSLHTGTNPSPPKRAASPIFSHPTVFSLTFLSQRK